ncbi:MAG: biotin synthase BioB [Desulfobulbaceae bacterium]|uniref:Biotin synthase n=1 Tax=Candidatus Desulfobia pelagia TaxID=2841692 RepID=A0A8J6NF20_9BACT|nr:biotin synthase BioB [Candidatus Desulfobia pelagia]
MALSERDIKALRALSCSELMAKALDVKLSKRGTSFSLCSIINAKSGQCSEDCRFCTQSSHYMTDAPSYPLKNENEIVAAAALAKEDGASRFSIVTSGRGLGARDLGRVAEIVHAIRARVDIDVCGSLGILSAGDLSLLREAGMSRYHHNLETSREFFPQVVSTHTFEDRINTIRAAQQAGMEVCAGGIIGLGETEEDRISMALSLAECDVLSVPLNVLMPLAGTPMGHHPPVPAFDILRTIALFRLILPEAALRLAAGRESALGDFLSTAFMAGADGMMIGGYLTQRGRNPEMDRRFVQEIQKLWTG